MMSERPPMIDVPPSRTLILLLFRSCTKERKKRDELILVRKKVFDKWTAPIADLIEPPSKLIVSYMLAEFFNNVEIESLAPLPPEHWAEAADIFAHYDVYECRISEKTRGKDFTRVLSTNGHDYNQASGIHTVDTFALLQLPYVQERLQSRRS